MEKIANRFKKTVFFPFFLKSLPFVLVLLVIFIENMPVNLSYFSFVRPKITLVFIFLISVYFPDRVGYFRVFCLGLLADLLGFSLLGLNAFLFLSVYVLIKKYSNYLSNRLFLFVYAVFMMVVLAVMVIEIIFVATAQRSFPSCYQIIPSYLLTISVYPFIARIFYFIEKNTDES